MISQGLTEAQVAKKLAEQRAKNKKSPQSSHRATVKIILKNTLTIFNLVNLILAVMVLLVGSYKNLLFILIAIANTLISIINELRAKKIVDKLKLVSEQKPTVIRDGKPRQISPEDIVEGDLVILSIGDQIPADARVEQGSIEVNEALLTGEQDNIAKHPGDQLISGSFIVSGTCQAVITSRPDQSFIGKLEKSAHTIKPADSQLFKIMNNIVKTISFALIPIGVLLLLARFRVPDTTPEVAVTSTVAALINMIPEGLILLTSSVLALATIRLSKKQVLVQDLYSVETLARVDCICLDKTGTLTTGRMKVKEFLPAAQFTNQSKSGAKSSNPADTQPENALLEALELILAHSGADNATSTALKNALPKSPSKAPKTVNAKAAPAKNVAATKAANLAPASPEVLETIPFSSDRKYSGVKTADAEYLMGALEFMTTNPDFLAEERSIPGNYRIISVLRKQGKSETLLGFALLEDELRPDAGKIIQFFTDNDVAVKIISGDNLKTVQSIAEQVKVPNPRPVDLSAEPTPINYDKLVANFNIFTRVTPAQKKSLVLALKKQGSTVAMTGDGVNDILAMKEADCSIAIGEGSDAARRSAKIVLLSSDFSTVPAIVAEGRQSINNLERSATLFLTKTVYAAILAVLFTVVPIEYPFSPISMTLLNTLCIGLPGLILALEPNTARIKNQFVTNIKKFSIPTGIAISVVAVLVSIIGEVNNFPRPLLITTSVISVFVVDFILLCRISRPFTKLRLALLATILAVFLLALFLPLSATFFDFYHFL